MIKYGRSVIAKAKLLLRTTRRMTPLDRNKEFQGLIPDKLCLDEEGGRYLLAVHLFNTVKRKNPGETEPRSRKPGFDSPDDIRAKYGAFTRQNLKEEKIIIAGLDAAMKEGEAEPEQTVSEVVPVRTYSSLFKLLPKPDQAEAA